MRKIAFILGLILLAQAVIAQEEVEVAESVFEEVMEVTPAAEQQSGVISKNGLVLQVSTLPEAKLIFNQNFIFPVLQGEGGLTSGNNLRLKLSAEITPVGFNGIFETILTPIAFLEFAVGGRASVGWPFDLLNVVGTGLNQPVEDTQGLYSGGAKVEEYNGGAFDALMYKAWAGGTFQFDLAAVIPGDWNHIVMQTYHEINYQANTSAMEGEGWYFEADSGENCNGLNYYGSIVLGYQMPLSPVLKMVAFMVEMDKYLYNTPGRTVWGDDLIRWHVSNILQFQVSEKFGFGIVTQFRTMRNFTNFDLGYAKRNDINKMHYQSRILDTDNPLRFEFYRVAGLFSFSL